MARKKIVLARIPNESKRKSTLKKRKRGLFKKVDELSTLCEAEIAVVVYSPGEEEPEVWPSSELAVHRLSRFESVPDVEKNMKMMTHETYLEERLDKESNKIRKDGKKNEEQEMMLLMRKLAEGMSLTEFNERQFQAMHAYAGDNKKKLKEIKRERDRQSYNNPPPPPPPESGNSGGGGVAGEKSIVAPTEPGSGVGLPPGNVASTSGGGGDDDDELPDDLNAAFPHFLSP